MVRMKFIRFITYLFYRYYSKGPTSEVSYMKTICSVIFLIWIHIFIVLIIIGKTDLIPNDDNSTKGMKYLKMALISSPFFLFFLLFIKEKDLKSMEYDEDKIRVATKVLWTYVIFSLILMFVLMVTFA